MIQEEGALVKGCSKSDEIWASFMGSFCNFGGLQPPPPQNAYVVAPGKGII